MPDIEMGIDSLIQRLISVYYAFGIWHKGKQTKLRKFCRIFVFFFCTISYPVALAGGGLVSHDLGDAIFLFTLGVIVGVLEFKGYYIFFKQEKILKLLNVMGKQSVPNNDHLLRTVNRALNIFKKCCVIFVVISVGLTAIIMILSSPLISDKLPFNIWFPLDYKQNYIAHWITHCFVVANELFVILVSLLSSLMWYAMLNSSLKYDILGHRLKNFTTNWQLDNSASFNAKDGTDPHLYEKQLIKCITLHRELQQYGTIRRRLLWQRVNFFFVCRGVESMGSFFSPLFFVQIGTSAFCICGSLYILAVVI